jgi:hypothetical protein
VLASFACAEFADGQVFETLLGVLPAPVQPVEQPQTTTTGKEKRTKEKDGKSAMELESQNASASRVRDDEASLSPEASQYADQPHYKALCSAFERARSVFNIPQVPFCWFFVFFVWFGL